MESVTGREAMLLAQVRRFNNVIIDLDCQAVIKALNGGSNVIPIELMDILNDVRRLASSFIDISFSFICRNSNKAAHSLTTLTLRDASYLYDP